MIRVRYLIIYDIADHRRLQRVAKVLGDYGRRLQNSTFEARLTPPQLTRLLDEVGRIIDPAVDNVKYLPICGACEGRLEVLGGDSLLESESAFKIV